MKLYVISQASFSVNYCKSTVKYYLKKQYTSKIRSKRKHPWTFLFLWQCDKDKIYSRFWYY